MEKISRIVPANHRIHNLPTEWRETSESGSSARPSGRNILHSSKDLALQAHRDLRGWRAKEARHNEIADKIQTGFFSTPGTSSEVVNEPPQSFTQDFLRGSDLMLREDTLSTAEADPLSAHDMDIDNYIADVMAEAEAFKNQSDPISSEEEWSSYPKGSFLNVEA